MDNDNAVAALFLSFQGVKLSFAIYSYSHRSIPGTRLSDKEYVQHAKATAATRGAATADTSHAAPRRAQPAFRLTSDPGIPRQVLTYLRWVQDMSVKYAKAVNLQHAKDLVGHLAEEIAELRRSKLGSEQAESILEYFRLPTDQQVHTSPGCGWEPGIDPAFDYVVNVLRRGYPLQSVEWFTETKATDIIYSPEITQNFSKILETFQDAIDDMRQEGIKTS